jgi:DNA-binding protein HU-beta
MENKMENFTKKRLIEYYAAQAGKSQAAAASDIEALTIVLNTIFDKYSLTIPGFGSFITRKTKARTGRNPQTGRSIKIPAKIKTTFKRSATS